MNRQVAHFLVHHGDDLASESPARKLVSGDITTYPISFMRWRACTALIVLQVSARGMRVLCYLDTKRKHTGSWATDCSGVRPSVLQEVAQVLEQLSGSAPHFVEESKRAKRLEEEAKHIRRQRDSLDARLSAIEAELRPAAASKDVRMLKGAKALICMDQPCQELRPDRAKALFGVP